MSREEAIGILTMLRCQDTRVAADAYEQALEMAIQALEQEPCEDATSRQAVLDIVCGNYEKDGWGESNFYKAINDLPSVTHKSGKWIKDECGNVICSECKRFRRDCRYGHTNYCNHCGAKMESEE